MILTRYPAGELPPWANDPMEEEPMIEERSTLIRTPEYTRVLRLVCDGRHTWPLRYRVWPGRPMCDQCGCTNRFSCEGGCQWVDQTRRLCSKCAERMAVK